MLTTGIGVRGWFEAAESLALGDRLLTSLCCSTVLVRGKKAHGAAVTAGLAPVWVTPGGTSTELLEEMRRRDVRDLRVAVQLDGASEAPLVRAVGALGADVIAVPVYRWTLPEDDAPAARLVDEVIERRVDAVTFTSRPQIGNLFALADAHDRGAALRAALRADVRVACVGPVCAGAATDAGCTDVIVPTRHRLGSMVQALAATFDRRAEVMTLGGRLIRVQGRAVIMEDRVEYLSRPETDILRALATPFGAVVSKERLLAQMAAATPGGGRPDEHAVEVAVGRLRRRLGSAGTGVQTVIRRGYRLSAV